MRYEMCPVQPVCKQHVDIVEGITGNESSSFEQVQQSMTRGENAVRNRIRVCEMHNHCEGCIFAQAHTEISVAYAETIESMEILPEDADEELNIVDMNTLIQKHRIIRLRKNRFFSWR